MYLSVYLLEESLKGFTDIVPSLCTYFKEILDLMVICKLQLEHYSHTAICPSIPIYTDWLTFWPSSGATSLLCSRSSLEPSSIKLTSAVAC